MKQILTIISALLLSWLATSCVSEQGAVSEWEILNQEADSLYQQGKYDSAVVVAKKGLKVAEKNFGPDHPDVATSLSNLPNFTKLGVSTHRLSRFAHAR